MADSEEGQTSTNDPTPLLQNESVENAEDDSDVKERRYDDLESLTYAKFPHCYSEVCVSTVFTS